jgi:putative PIG3 family NAD(P)H quinone oxidoreductase
MPVPGRGEILIRVRAAGINWPDVMQRKGQYPPPPDASPILGLEVSGEIAALGEGTTNWKVGDSLCALVNGGGYAEYVSVPAGQCLPIPKGVNPVEAASLPETCFTVWANVFDLGKLKAGESFLVHGGSGGIGVTAIQMAKALGARVFATAGTEGKCEACRDLGADLAIDYREEDFVEAVLRETGGRGVDVILDVVGGDYIERNMKIAAVGGRIVIIAFRKGSKVLVDFLPLIFKRLTITGSTLRPRSTAEKADIARSLRGRIWPLVESGKIKPRIAATFPLEEAAKAHKLIESGRHIGKIVLEVGSKKEPFPVRPDLYY